MEAIFFVSCVTLENGNLLRLCENNTKIRHWSESNLTPYVVIPKIKCIQGLEKTSTFQDVISEMLLSKFFSKRKTFGTAYMQTLMPW